MTQSVNVAACVLTMAGCAPGTSATEKDTAGDSDTDTPGAPNDTADTADTADSGEPPPRALSTGTHTLAHGGMERTFRLYLPEDLPEGAPLIIAMHGYTSSAATLQSYAGLDARAETHGFAVVYPQGTRDRYGNNYWEVGYDFHDGSVDDVGFIRALAAYIDADQGLGPIYATGMSNGGDMSYRLACEASDLVTAVAPVAGCMMGWLAEACTPATPVPVLEIHGTDDDVTLWEGDPDNRGGWGPYLSTEDGIAVHVALHGLDSYEEEALPDSDSGDRSTVLARRWTRSDSDKAVWLYEVQGGGHDWPGAFGNQDIHASDVLWTFLSQYR